MYIYVSIICIGWYMFLQIVLYIYLVYLVRLSYVITCKLYSAISGLTIDPCPFIGLFGVPADDLPLQKAQLNSLAYSSLLARRLILLNWKSDQPPSFGRWICDVMFFLKIEKMRYNKYIHYKWIYGDILYGMASIYFICRTD